MERKILAGQLGETGSKECLKSTFCPQQEGLVELHRGEKGFPTNIQEKFIWSGEKTKPGAGNGLVVTQQVISAALNGK